MGAILRVLGCQLAGWRVFDLGAQADHLGQLCGVGAFAGQRVPGLQPGLRVLRLAQLARERHQLRVGVVGVVGALVGQRQVQAFLRELPGLPQATARVLALRQVVQQAAQLAFSALLAVGGARLRQQALAQGDGLVVAAQPVQQVDLAL